METLRGSVHLRNVIRYIDIRVGKSRHHNFADDVELIRIESCEYHMSIVDSLRGSVYTCHGGLVETVRKRGRPGTCTGRLGLVNMIVQAETVRKDAAGSLR
jgi:hypothetical protein